MMNSAARRLAMRSRAGPIRPPSPPTLWHFAHWALPLRSKKSFRPALGIAGQVGLPGRSRRRAGQAADVGNQLADLVRLECVAQLLHGGLGHAVLDHAGDVVVGAAVDPAAVGQVGAFAAAAGAAVTAAAQPAKQGLPLRQDHRIRRRWRCGRRCLQRTHGARPADCDRSRPEPAARSSHQTRAEHRTERSVSWLLIDSRAPALLDVRQRQRGSYGMCQRAKTWASRPDRSSSSQRPVDGVFQIRGPTCEPPRRSGKRSTDASPEGSRGTRAFPAGACSASHGPRVEIT